MRLTSIELIGFKSFQEKTSISLPEGFCAIVGPNGCGKSNIVDAILWVLGAQSAKLLRGEKMTDVIFSGSKTKKKAQFAEVTLQFDNQDRFLPLEANEVSVGRRIFRSGEGEYFINRQPVRMKDVQELFATTGLGKEGFSVIGQGQVDGFLMKSPAEKRKLIEEIAGIHRFFEKKKEAETHLKTSLVNIQRATDVHEEVSRQMEKLKEQKKAFEEFKKAEDELFLDKKEYEEKRLSLMKIALELKQKKVREVEESIRDVFSKESEGESTLRLMGDQLRSQHRNREALGEEAQEVKGRVALYQQAEKTIEQRKEECRVQIERAKKRIALVDEEKARSEQEQKEILEKIDKQQKELQDKEEMSPHVEREVSIVEEQAQEIQRVAFSTKGVLQEIENRWKSTSGRRELALHEKDVLLRKKKACLDGKKAHEASLEKEKILFQEMSELKQKMVQEIEKESALLKKQKEELLFLEKELSQCEKESREAIEKRSFLLAEIRGFETVQKQFLEAGKTCQKALKAFRSVSLFVDWLAKKEVQLSPALLQVLDAKYAQTLVLTTAKEAQELLTWNKKNGAGPLSFLVEECIPGGARALLTSIEECQTNDEPFLSKKSVQERYFEKEGLLCDANGVFFFHSQEKGLFSNAHELKNKQKELESLVQVVEKLEQRVQEKKGVLQSLKSSYDAKEHQMRKEDMRLVEVTLKVTHSESQQALYRERVLHTDQMIKECDEDIAKVDSRIADAEKEIASFQEERAVLQKSAAEKQQKASEVLEALGRQKKVLQEFQTDLFKRKETLFKLESSKQLIEQKKIHLDKEKKELEVGIQSLLEETSVLEEKRKGLLADSEEATHESQALVGKLEEVKNKIQELEVKKKEIEREHQKTKERKESIIEKKAHLLASLEMEKARFDELSTSFHETFGASAFTLLTSEKELDRLSSSIRARAAWLEAHQNVNHEALKEYEECEGRFHATEEQLKDLHASYEKICTLISTLEKESSTLFYETMKILESYFVMNFNHLFPGGQARLLEVDSGEERGGIELFVELPGKEQQSLKIMSGGERCLTALAFLFALFQARKSPLCLLDEVDAPLDEANVERFCSLLDSCGHTQFLIVTHNKRTMEKASALLGVTMPEKGVSKVLQVSFSEQALHC